MSTQYKSKFSNYYFFYKVLLIQNYFQLYQTRNYVSV
jgi:hypothetical protein